MMFSSHEERVRCLKKEQEIMSSHRVKGRYLQMLMCKVLKHFKIKLGRKRAIKDINASIAPDSFKYVVLC